MTDKILEIKTGLVIQKPAGEVYEAIVDPEKMSNYFISNGNGRMEEGKTLTWQFAEMPKEFPVRVAKMEKDKYISFHWEGMENHETLVEIRLGAKEANSTFVTITEKKAKMDEQGIKWLKSNTEGWANFLACLKAWMEYGINLRKGAFDLSQMG
jgi:uncharacterized protein YndB with AHSA1/START domain